MVHWAWIPVTFVVGAIFGMFVVALMETARDDDNRKRWWEE